MPFILDLQIQKRHYAHIKQYWNFSGDLICLVIALLQLMAVLSWLVPVGVWGDVPLYFLFVFSWVSWAWEPFVCVVGPAVFGLHSLFFLGWVVFLLALHLGGILFGCGLFPLLGLSLGLFCLLHLGCGFFSLFIFQFVGLLCPVSVSFFFGVFPLI